MADERRNGAPIELVYEPAPSWQPPLIAFGLAAVLASLFTWWPYGVIGGVIALFALFAWIRDARAGYSRLPRRQRMATAVLPAVPLQRTDDE
ncbi:MAG TPA: hypothetical protein VD765_10795 [Solirubrobacterales bacterium]|jgi:hypothetical protein|nr:hypothetical protein [Solirubrobacterales bacterium]